MASTSIRVINYSPYYISVKATVPLFSWWEWAKIQIPPSSDAYLPAEWWWYHVGAWLEPETLDKVREERKALVKKARAEVAGADNLNYETYTISGPSVAGLPYVYGGSTVNVRPNAVDELFTSIVRKLDPGLTLYELEPPLLIDLG